MFYIIFFWEKTFDIYSKQNEIYFDFQAEASSKFECGYDLV